MSEQQPIIIRENCEEICTYRYLQDIFLNSFILEFDTSNAIRKTSLSFMNYNNIDAFEIKINNSYKFIYRFTNILDIRKVSLIL